MTDRRHFKSFSEARKNSDPTSSASDMKDFLKTVTESQDSKCYIQEEREDEYLKAQLLVRRKSTSFIEIRLPSLLRRGSAPGKSCLKLKEDGDSGVHWTSNFNTAKSVKFSDEAGGELVEVVRYDSEAFDNLGDEEDLSSKDSGVNSAPSLLRTRSSTPPRALSSSSDDLEDLSRSSSVMSSTDDLSQEEDPGNRSPSPLLEALLRRKDSLCLAKELLNSKKKKTSSQGGRRDSIIVAKYKRQNHYEIDEM